MLHGASTSTAVVMDPRMLLLISQASVHSSQRCLSHAKRSIASSRRRIYIIKQRLARKRLQNVMLLVALLSALTPSPRSVWSYSR